MRGGDVHQGGGFFFFVSPRGMSRVVSELVLGCASLPGPHTPRKSLFIYKPCVCAAGALRFSSHIPREQHPTLQNISPNDISRRIFSLLLPLSLSSLPKCQ